MVFAKWVEFGRDGFYAAYALSGWLGYPGNLQNPVAQMWFAKLAGVVQWLQDLLPGPVAPDFIEAASRYDCAYNRHAHLGSLFIAACVWEAARAKLSNAPPQRGERWVEVFGHKVTIEVVRRITERVDNILPNVTMDAVESLSPAAHEMRLFLVSRAFTNMAILVRKNANSPDGPPEARMLQSCVKVDVRQFVRSQDDEHSTLAFMTNGVSVDVVSGGRTVPVFIPDDLTAIPCTATFLAQLLPEVRRKDQAAAWLNSIEMPE